MSKAIRDRSHTTQDFDLVDLHTAEGVEILVGYEGKLWVNLNGKCLLRVGKTQMLTLEDKRNGNL